MTTDPTNERWYQGILEINRTAIALIQHHASYELGASILREGLAILRMMVATPTLPVTAPTPIDPISERIHATLQRAAACCSSSALGDCKTTTTPKSMTHVDIRVVEDGRNNCCSTVAGTVRAMAMSSPSHHNSVTTTMLYLIQMSNNRRSTSTTWINLEFECAVYLHNMGVAYYCMTMQQQEYNHHKLDASFPEATTTTTLVNGSMRLLQLSHRIFVQILRREDQPPPIDILPSILHVTMAGIRNQIQIRQRHYVYRNTVVTADIHHNNIGDDVTLFWWSYLRQLEHSFNGVLEWLAELNATSFRMAPAA